MSFQVPHHNIEQSHNWKLSQAYQTLREDGTIRYHPSILLAKSGHFSPERLYSLRADKGKEAATKTAFPKEEVLRPSEN